MREFTVQLDEKYIIPQNILSMTPSEWEIIISYTSKLLLTHDATSLEMNTESIEQMYKDKYSEELESKTAEINDKLKEISDMRELHEKQLKKQRKEIEANYKLLNNETLQTLNSSIEAKETIILSLKEQNLELQNVIKRATLPLQEQIDIKTREIEEIRNNYEKQREEYENACRISNKKALQEAIENKDTIIISLREQLKELSQLQNKQIKPLQEQLNTYRDQITELQIQNSKAVAEETARVTQELTLAHNEELKNAYKDYMNKTDELRSEIESKNYLSILSKLEPVTKYYGGSNQEKGDGGEIAIRQVLQRSEKYDDALIEDVSGHAASGDIYFKWRNISCLIEVKNKATITKEDISKFERDIQESKTKNINCAMFISTRCKSIPIVNGTRSIMQSSYVGGVPVLYIYAPPPSNEIHFALACLEKIIQTSNSSNEEHEELREQFIDYYNYVLDYQKFFDKKLKECQREVKEIAKHADKFNELCDKLSPTYARLINKPETTEEEQSEEDSPSETAEESLAVNMSSTPLSQDAEEQLKQLSEEYIKLSLKNISPTIQILTQSFNVPVRVIERIGFKKIASSAHLKYLSLYVTTEKANDLITFYNTNKRYPNRKELTQNKFFPDHVLRNISKVTKQKKIAECIANYIEQELLANATTTEDTTEE